MFDLCTYFIYLHSWSQTFLRQEGGIVYVVLILLNITATPKVAWVAVTFKQHIKWLPAQ